MFFLILALGFALGQQHVPEITRLRRDGPDDLGSTTPVPRKAAQPSETKCYKISRRQRVKIRELLFPDNSTSLLGDGELNPSTSQVSRDDQSDDKLQSRIQHGFDDPDQDGIERFVFDVICRCANESAVLHHGTREDFGTLSQETYCNGTLRGSSIEYQLDKPGICFVASRRAQAMGMGALYPYFLHLEDPGRVLNLYNGLLRANDSYFEAETFSLANITYNHVCNRDRYKRQPLPKPSLNASLPHAPDEYIEDLVHPGLIEMPAVIVVGE